MFDADEGQLRQDERDVGLARERHAVLGLEIHPGLVLPGFVAGDALGDAL
jgi:hypothetical protein